jgi:hypothetical protein
MIDKKMRLPVSESSFSVVPLIAVLSLALLFFACENGLSSIAGDSPPSVSALSITTNTQDARISERANRRAAFIEEARKNGEWPNRANRLQLREEWQKNREEWLKNHEGWIRNHEEWIRNREERIRNREERIRNSEERIRNSEWRRNSGERMRNRERPGAN